VSQQRSPLMDAITRFANSNILVIDDIASMRTQIVSNLALLGFKNVWAVGSCDKARAHLAKMRMDLILCDYHLGEVTSGQQFLEHLRSKQLIPYSTLFVMVTAKRAYEDVMRAAECAPDDYLVKPFTSTQLNTRLTSLIEKRNRFKSVHTSMQSNDWPAVVRHCDAIIATHDRFAMDATKIKGQALLKSSRAIDAEKLYRNILEQRPLGWAKLGLARALKLQTRMPEAEELLETLIAEGRSNSAGDRMNAYDELSDLLQSTERGKEALALLQDAMDVSPGSPTRTRKVTALAAAEGELDLAEKSVRQLLADYKNSDLKDAGDYLLAADVLSSNGHAGEALATVREVRRAFDDIADQQVLSIAEATAHIANGDTQLGKELLQDISPESASELTPNAAAVLGKSLYKLGDQAAAEKVMRHLVQNNPDDPDVLRTVHAAMAAAGQQAQISALVASSLNEVAEINNEGVRLAYAGEFQSAIDMLTRAADLLPGNVQFLSNAGLVIALALTRGEADAERLTDCIKYRQLLAAGSPQHPKLSQIDTLLMQYKGERDAASRSA
jgi:DNA-binding response OmpR family regulator/TolA-binding protein